MMCLVGLTRGGVGDEGQGDVLGGGREWSQATECRDRYRPGQTEQRLSPRDLSSEKPPVHLHENLPFVSMVNATMSTKPTLSTLFIGYTDNTRPATG